MKSGFRSICACLFIGLGLLAGCNDRTIGSQLSPDDDSNQLEYGGVRGLNYSPYFIHTFNVQGHDNEISSGALNIMPATSDNMPSGGNEESCCTAFLKKWRPGLKITVRWLADKELDGVTYGAWYKAETELPEYGPATYNMWVIFLPGDRVKVVIRDNRGDGARSVVAKPADDDPYIAVGTVDDERTKKEAVRRERVRQLKAARAAEQEAERQKKENRQ